MCFDVGETIRRLDKTEHSLPIYISTVVFVKDTDKCDDVFVTVKLKLMPVLKALVGIEIITVKHSSISSSRP